MIRYVVLLLLSLVVLPLAATAQVVETERGSVEFIGLERWTIPQIRDAMVVHAPGKPLGECAAVLQEIGFPAASSTYDVRTRRTVVIVVEPHKAHLVRTRPALPDSFPDIGEWTEIVSLVRNNPRAFDGAIQEYAHVLHRLTLPGFAEMDRQALHAMVTRKQRDSLEVRQVLSFLQQKQDDTERERALNVLAYDGNPYNRKVAAAVLMNFGDSDRVWWALMKAQQDPTPEGLTAHLALAGLSRTSPRPVDWTPVVETIRHILNGSNVWVLYSTMEVLEKTHVSPTLASEILKDGGDLIVASVRAQYEPARKAAHRVLVHLSGEDFGPDVERWQGWIRGLHPSTTDD